MPVRHLKSPLLGQFNHWSILLVKIHTELSSKRLLETPVFSYAVPETSLLPSFQSDSDVLLDTRISFFNRLHK